MNILFNQDNSLLKLIRNVLFLVLTIVLTNSSFSQNYKNHWFFGGATSLSPTEINSLTSIANLCLDEGGNATITARALLASYTQNAFDFVDCTEIDFGSSNRLSQQKVRTINNSTFKNSTEKDILLYPNPNNGMFTINHQLNENILNLEIVDVRGKLVLNKKLIHNKEQIDLQHVNKGLYFVTLTNEFGKVIYMNKVSVK